MCQEAKYMTLRMAGERLLLHFGDTCDISTLSQMLWAWDQQIRTMDYYHKYMKDMANE